MERTQGSGFEWMYRNGQEAGNCAILESLGGGVACVDYDRDGRDDVCITGGGDFPAASQIAGRRCGLFQNLGDWKFRSTAEAAHFDAGRFYNHGVEAGDFDGDGFKDVVAPVKRDDGLHLVAGLHHTYEYTVVDVTGRTDAAVDRFTVRPRGTRYEVPDSDVDYYFGADTIVLTPCGGTPTAFLWNGTGFDPQPLAP